MNSVSSLLEIDNRMSKKAREILLKSAELVNDLDCDSIKENGLKDLNDALKDCVRKDIENQCLLEKVHAIYENVDKATDVKDLPDLDACYQDFEQYISKIHSLDFTKEIRKDPDICHMKNILKHYSQGNSEDSHKESVDNEGMEIVTTQQTINLTDPITKCRIEDPVRHRPCGHVYDKKSLESMIIARGKKGFRCAYMGCNYRNPIQLEDTETALDYVQEIRRQQNRED